MFQRLVQRGPVNIFWLAYLAYEDHPRQIATYSTNYSKTRRVIVEYCSEQVVGLELDPTISVRLNITFIPVTSLQLKNH